MDRAYWLQGRRKRYLAQVLSEFERLIEPMIPTIPAAEMPDVKEFKGIVRARFNALAVDATDIYEQTERGTQVNAEAQRLKDRLGTGTPARTRS